MFQWIYLLADKNMFEMSVNNGERFVHKTTVKQRMHFLNNVMFIKEKTEGRQHFPFQCWLNM